MKLHRILWVANLVLLAVLGYAIAGFILGNDSGQKFPVTSKPETKEKEINLGKNLSHTGNHRIILERNIFGSAGVDTVKENPEKGKPMVPAPVAGEPLQFRLLGTVAGDEEVACAVVGDGEKKGPNCLQKEQPLLFIAVSTA